MMSSSYGSSTYDHSGSSYGSNDMYYGHGSTYDGKDSYGNNCYYA